MRYGVLSTGEAIMSYESTRLNMRLVSRAMLTQVAHSLALTSACSHMAGLPNRRMTCLVASLRDFEREVGIAAVNFPQRGLRVPLAPFPGDGSA
jgi:hypothetical protein